MTCVANPCGFKSRYNLYDAVADHILDVVGGNLLTVDLAFGDDENALNPRPPSPNYRLIQVPFVDQREPAERRYKQSASGGRVRVLDRRRY